MTWKGITPEQRKARAAKAGSASKRPKGFGKTDCDRVYSDAEREFMQACEAYKKAQKKVFLSQVEHLGILLSLGYRKQA